VEEYKIDKDYIAEEKQTQTKTSEGDKKRFAYKNKIDRAIGDVNSKDTKALVKRLQDQLTNLGKSNDKYKIINKSKDPNIVTLVTPDKLSGFQNQEDFDLSNRNGIIRLQNTLYNRYDILQSAEETSGSSSSMNFVVAKPSRMNGATLTSNFLSHKVTNTSDNGVVFSNDNTPHRCIRVDYIDRIKGEDASGRQVEINTPGVDFLLIPVETN